MSPPGMEQWGPRTYLERVSGMRYRQARLSILNCQRLGSQVLSVYHCSPNSAEGSEMSTCLIRSHTTCVLRSSLFQDEWFPLLIRKRFMKTHMNKLAGLLGSAAHRSPSTSDPSAQPSGSADMPRMELIPENAQEKEIMTREREYLGRTSRVLSPQDVRMSGNAGSAHASVERRANAAGDGQQRCDVDYFVAKGSDSDTL